MGERDHLTNGDDGTSTSVPHSEATTEQSTMMTSLPHHHQRALFVVAFLLLLMASTAPAAVAAFAAADAATTSARTPSSSTSTSTSRLTAFAFHRTPPSSPPPITSRRRATTAHRREGSGCFSSSSALFLAAGASPSSSSTNSKSPISSRIIRLTNDSMEEGAKKVFQVNVDLPKGAAGTSTAAGAAPGGPKLQALLTVEPVLDQPSVLVEIKYQVPFELSVEPVNNLALCTKAGPSPTLSERKGDVLRFTSQWTLGLPRQVGLAATAAAFSGGLSWQPSLFDVMKAVKWEQVVNALVSNTQERTSEVVLIFERPMQDDDDNEATMEEEQ